MRILALKLRRLGDTVLWTSALAALGAHFPAAEIDLAVPEPYLPLFAHDPRFARVVGVGPSLGDAVRAGRKLRDRRYDLALVFHASSRSLAVAIAAGAKERLVHHHSRKGKRFFSQRPIVGLGVVTAAIERDLNVARTVGYAGPTPATRIFPGGESVARGAARVADLPGPKDAPVVLLGIGASRRAKEWPLERYVALASALGARARIGVVYDREDAFRGQAHFRDALKRVAGLLPTPSLDDLLGVLPHAAVYAGSDSGVKHLAVALGVATVTLFGPESIGEWHGYPEDRHRVLQKPVLCRANDAETPSFAWCGVDTCPLGSHACLALITPDEVAREVTALTACRMAPAPDEP